MGLNKLIISNNGTQNLSVCQQNCNFFFIFEWYPPPLLKTPTDTHTDPLQNQRGIQTIVQKPLHTRADVPDDTRQISTIRKAAKRHRQDRFGNTLYS